MGTSLDDRVLEGFRRPSASASQRNRHDACKSSLARSLEVWHFCRNHGIEGPVSGAAADRGTNLHDIVSKIPIRCEGFDGGVTETYAQSVDRVCEDMGVELEGYNKWVCKTFAVSRDAALDYMLDHFPGGRGAVEEIEVNADEERLAHDFGKGGVKAPYSGLPDFLAIAKGVGVQTAALVDFKSGFSEHLPASRNPQIKSLVGLVGTLHPEVDTVYAGLISEARGGDPLELGIYDKGAISYNADQVGNLARDLAPGVDVVDAARGEIDDEQSRKLDSQAVTGNHCIFCEGQVCCNKFKQQMAQNALYRIEPSLQHAVDFKSATNRKKTLPPTMTLEDLSESLALATAVDDLVTPFQSMLEKSSALAMQALENGVEVPDAEIVSSGKSRDALVVSEMEKLYEALSPVLPGVDKSEFWEAVATKPEIPKLREFIAGKLEVKPSHVRDELEKKLGEDTPLVSKEFGPKVQTTADISEIIEELDLKARSVSEPVVEPVGVAPEAKAPVVAAAPVAPEPAPAPKVAKRKKKVAAGGAMQL